MKDCGSKRKFCMYQRTNNIVPGVRNLVLVTDLLLASWVTSKD